MMNAIKQFSQEDRERISRRIAVLETHTDAEVVCAVATESGRYDRAESIWGLIVGLAALITGNKIVALGGWDAPASLSLGLQAILLMGGFVLGSVLASYGHGLRRLLVSNAEMNGEVHRSVHQVFSQFGVGGTKHQGGILIYLSLFERQLRVQCDRALTETISQADLDAIRDAVQDKVRAGDPTGGLLAGLDCADSILAKAQPASSTAVDPLSNDLLLFHPRP